MEMVIFAGNVQLIELLAKALNLKPVWAPLHIFMGPDGSKKLIKFNFRRQVFHEFVQYVHVCYLWEHRIGSFEPRLLLKEC